MARCYSRDLKQNDPFGKKISNLEPPDDDSDSDVDYIPHVVIRSGNDDENVKETLKSSDFDSDSDVSCEPHVDMKDSTINISCFSEDKLPSSFVNEVVSILSNNIVIRSSIQNLDECKKWITEFGDLTSTKWNLRDSNPCGKRFICWKKYVCHHSAFNKVPVEKNKKKISKNLSCLATIDIKVKLKTSRTKKSDSFIKKGLLAIIKINDVHNHSCDTAEELKYLRRMEWKEVFIKYFNDGKGVAESCHHHEKILQLDHNIAKDDLATSYLNPPRRSVQYWYEKWRSQNWYQNAMNGVSEGAGSFKNANDIDEGASTSKISDGQGESLNQIRPVLSLKCLHEDSDDDSLPSKMDEDDPNSKFIDVNDVPELPLNDKDELQVDDALDVEKTLEEHPNLEPVNNKPPAMILIPVINFSAPINTIPLRTNLGGVHNFKIKIDCSSQPKRSDCAVFSDSRNKLYVCKDIPFVVLVSANNVPEGSVLRVQAVFSRPEHASNPITRCPTHVQQDFTKGLPAYEHFVQSINEGTVYEKDGHSKMSVSVPYVKPQGGEIYSQYVFKLTCFNSCVGGINRRPFTLVFTLENNKVSLGRQTLEAKVCACPNRDCKIDDDKQKKMKKIEHEKQKEMKKSEAEKLNNIKSKTNTLQMSQQDVDIKPDVNSLPIPANGQENLRRPMASGSEKPKYTISVNDQESFEFLQHMKVLYEMNVLPIVPDT